VLLTDEANGMNKGVHIFVVEDYLKIQDKIDNNLPLISEGTNPYVMAHLALINQCFD